jgi:phage terminase large subunit-like protein
VDVLTTSTAARRQPLVVYITTADYSRPSVCNRVHDRASKVRDGIIADSSFLPVIYEAGIEDDWTDPAVWAAANPNLGISVKLDYLQRECERAKNEPSYENTFKRLHLNIRTRQDVKAISEEAWRACADPIDEALLAGRTCYGGLDLSTKIDLSAWVLVFPPTDEDPRWRVLPRFYAPSDSAEKRERTDRVPYLTWARQGFLKLTEGNVVDYSFIEAQVLEDARRFDLREVAYDPWNATATATRLQDQGATMVEFGQGYRSMAEPTKELERLIVAGELAHPANAVLDWMASNVMWEIDPAGNPKPSKRKSTERIDGIVALVMGLGRALVQDNGASVYEDRGFIIL